MRRAVEEAWASTSPHVLPVLVRIYEALELNELGIARPPAVSGAMTESNVPDRLRAQEPSKARTVIHTGCRDHVPDPRT